jgi:hypothetical protein
MSDLKSQLEARFGARPPAVGEAPSAAPATTEQPFEKLDPWEHLVDPWLVELRRLGPQTGVGAIPNRPSLQAARQLTDKTCRDLKAKGRKREQAGLDGLRSSFLKKRESRAWGLIKDRFARLALSERAYRAIKQHPQIDPEKVLDRLDRLDRAELPSMGADRLRDLLIG